ncbi:putative inorganic phosphate cotransporter isoform X2 [Aethina tumida]|nr:putative inorganic phosphate cotransporter isoform X2 [Aethina tumida]
MMFLAAIISYGMRTNLSEGIVAMTAEEKDRPDPDIPTYPEWLQYKNTMLSSFFWGYICLQVVAGQIAKKYGPKWFLCGALCVTSLFSFLMPVMGEKIGYGGIIICRVFQGLAQGFLFPSFHHLLSVWTPHSERSKVITFVYAGGPLGNVIALPLTGYIADSKLGWPLAFYLYGTVGLLWAVMWFFLGSNSPSENKLMSDEERKFIQSETAGDDHSKVPTPWKAVFTSLPVWAIVVVHCGQNWGFWTLLTETPSYMNQILKFNLKENAMMSALPYLVLWLLSFIVSPICDYIITRKVTSTGITRKIFNTIGFYLPACALIGLSFIGESHHKLAVALLVVAVGVNSATYCGFHVNHIDISPIHSGTLMGITNSISNICSILAPLAVDVVKSFGYEESNKELWSIVFCLAAGVYVCTGMFYILFASGEVQEWNDPSYLNKPCKNIDDGEKQIELSKI